MPVHLKSVARRLLCALATTWLAMHAASAGASAPPAPRQIADGVYAFIADSGEASVANGGRVGNSGFVVGTDGVVVIDTGASYQHGRQMLEAISRVTDKPVRLAIITHAVQEFLFGNAAFAERGIPILAHQETVELMQARCAHCLERLRLLLGNELDGTRLVLPGFQISAGTVIEAGGRQLELLHFGWASTPGDLAVFDRATGTLFAGGLVSVDRIPEIRDCDFEGWLRALDRLESLPVERVVPGHGPVSGPNAINATAGYLRALDAEMKYLYANNSSLLDSVDAASLPAFRHWALYGTAHRQNALHRYLQLEIEELGGDPRSTAMPQQ
jgi:glyoxylase-like metal-dependent hydrolase (beta-lactamase superfamily II)